MQGISPSIVLFPTLHLKPRLRDLSFVQTILWNFSGLTIILLMSNQNIALLVSFSKDLTKFLVELEIYVIVLSSA